MRKLAKQSHSRRKTYLDLLVRMELRMENSLKWQDIIIIQMTRDLCKESELIKDKLTSCIARRPSTRVNMIRNKRLLLDKMVMTRRTHMSTSTSWMTLISKWTQRALLNLKLRKSLDEK